MISKESYALAVAYLTQCEAAHDAYVAMSSAHKAQLQTDFPTLFAALNIATTVRAQFDSARASDKAISDPNDAPTT